MLNWSATGVFIVAGLCIALKIEPYENFAFLLFLIGHCLSFINGYIKKISSLIIRYCFFIGIDFLGIYRYDSINVFYEWITGLINTYLV